MYDEYMKKKIDNETVLHKNKGLNFSLTGGKILNAEGLVRCDKLSVT